MESRVSAWQLGRWLIALRWAFRSAHSELAARYDFSTVRFHSRLPAILDEVFDYFAAVSRGPPGKGEAVVACVREYGEMTGRFLLGVPSQGR